MKKALSILMAVIMLCMMAFPAFAEEAEQKTYEERVAALKTNYSVTFGKARDPETWTVAQRDVSIRCVEEAVALLGSRAMHTVASYWINAKGRFDIYAGMNTKSVRGIAYHENGQICFSIPLLEGPYVFYNEGERYEWAITKKDAEESIMTQRRAIVHEIGHAYDDELLKQEGARAMAAINGPYSGSPYGGGWENYASPQGGQDASEDFATMFAFMLTSEQLISELEVPRENGGLRKRNSDDVFWKKCEAIYELMLRDFGVDSNAVKRAAWFLGKEEN